MIPVHRSNRFWGELLSKSPLIFFTSNQSFSSSPSYTSLSGSLSPGSSKQAESLKKLYGRDWLSPQEIVEVLKNVDSSSVLTLFDHVSRRKDYKPNESLYSLVIAKLAQARNFDAIDQLLGEIKDQKRCRLSDDFFYGVIKAYGNVGGRINRAMETLLDMPGYGCWPSVKTFNFVLNLLVSSKQFDAIREFYLGAGKLGVEIDSCSLNIVIKSHCESGSLESALQVLDEFPQQGCRPNERTFATLMHGLCEHGRVEDAFGLLERMEREGIWPDTVTFNTLIKGLRKQGRVDDAIELLERMRFKGCNPNSGSLQQVLYGLIEARRSMEAKRVMGEMVSKWWKPSFVSFKMLLMALCEEGLLEDADWVLRQMVRHGFVPRMGMWCKVLKKMPLEVCSFDCIECVDDQLT